VPTRSRVYAARPGRPGVQLEPSPVDSAWACVWDTAAKNAEQTQARETLAVRRQLKCLRWATDLP